MSYPIVRMYASETQAKAAADKLRNHDYSDDRIHVVSAHEGSQDAIAAAVMAGYVLRAHARVYAEGIAQGRSLVVVHVQYGGGMRAIEILEEFDPVDTGLRLPPEGGPTWDEAAPLSSALMMPVHCKNAEPLSTIIGIPTLCKPNANYLGKLFGPLLANRSWSLSALFGMPLLSKAAAPLSAAIGMRTLSANPAPLSSMLGLPLLSGRR